MTLPLRLGVYSDLAFGLRDGRPAADESFLLFMSELASSVESVAIAGRFDPGASAGFYTVPEHVPFVPLPHYPSLARPAEALRATVGSMRAFGRLLRDVDAVWLLGPHPLGVVFALQALARRRTVVLGVRQDLPAYMRSRHPDSRALVALGDLLEGAWRLLGRRCPVVAVGPDLARRYARARGVLPMTVSLVRAADVAPAARAPRADASRLRLLSVGRLDPEKNPLLLADVMAALAERGVDCELVVCGSGSLEDALAARLRELGVADRVDLRGYVPLDGTLERLYREADALLHVSFTEGMPQVLLEAFAAALPVVATAVGGVGEMAGDAALLVPPSDAGAAADAVARLARDPALRQELAERGLTRVRERTLEAETRRVAGFIAAAAGTWTNRSH